MEIYQTEKQQLSAIKKFWHKNKRCTSIVVIFCASIWALYSYWQHHQRVLISSASEVYYGMLQATMSDDYKSMRSHGDNLLTAYSKTPYAQLAALLLAKVAVEELDFVSAKRHLQWIIQKYNKQDIGWNIAKVRLARILYQQGSFDKALNVLQDVDDNSYKVLSEEVKGDVYLATGKLKLAREAYQQAIFAMPEKTQAPWLELKLKDIGEPSNSPLNQQEDI